MELNVKMKTIKELEIEETKNMCNNWYEEGRKDMKKDVLKLINNKLQYYEDVVIEGIVGENLLNDIKEIKARIEGGKEK